MKILLRSSFPRNRHYLSCRERGTLIPLTFRFVLIGRSRTFDIVPGVPSGTPRCREEVRNLVPRPLDASAGDNTGKRLVSLMAPAVLLPDTHQSRNSTVFHRHRVGAVLARAAPHSAEGRRLSFRSRGSKIDIVTTLYRITRLELE